MAMLETGGDARVGDLGDYFVGERVLVWVSTGSRAGFVVPAPYLRTRFGVDFVLVDTGAGAPIEVPVQRGRPLPLPDMPDGVEILSGVAQGDVLVMP